MNKNDIIELEITSLTNECFGVGKADGMVIFVPFSAIGDKLKVRIVKVKKTYCYGRIEEITQPSPDRITPDCPVYGKCGGCSLRHITYEAELKSKEQFVKDSFQRIGGLNPEFLPIIANNQQYGYRNKLQMPVGQSKNGELVSGFYATHSHRIVPCDRCLLQPDIFSDIVNKVKSEVTALGITPYNEETKKGTLRHIYIRKGHYSGEICLCLVATKNDKRFSTITEKITALYPDIKSVVLNINKKDTNVILGEEEVILYGNSEITDIMCGNKISIAPKAFYQVNTPAAEKLYAIAKDFAEPAGKTVLDLYCGAGTIGLSMAREAKQIIGVEIIPEAIENAKKNAKANNIDNTEFICADAAKAAKILLNRGVTPDVVIVDPPRKGCGEEAVNYIAQFGAERIVMVSCNSATAARDCAYFEKLMYKTEKVVPVDLFSRTEHVESVVCLSREKAEHQMKLYAGPFEKIKSGQKTIELRLNDEKRQKIKNGDSIVFTNTTNGKKLKASVLQLHRFNSFEELYQSLPLLKCGYTEETINSAKASDMEAYYSAEEQAKYGVVGIELSPPKQITDECVVLMSKADK